MAKKKRKKSSPKKSPVEKLILATAIIQFATVLIELIKTLVN